MNAKRPTMRVAVHHLNTPSYPTMQWTTVRCDDPELESFALKVAAALKEDALEHGELTTARLFLLGLMATAISALIVKRDLLQPVGLTKASYEAKRFLEQKAPHTYSELMAEIKARRPPGWRSTLRRRRRRANAKAKERRSKQ